MILKKHVFCYLHPLVHMCYVISSKLTLTTMESKNSSGFEDSSGRAMQLAACCGVLLQPREEIIMNCDWFWDFSSLQSSSGIGRLQVKRWQGRRSLNGFEREDGREGGREGGSGKRSYHWQWQIQWLAVCNGIRCRQRFKWWRRLVAIGVISCSTHGHLDPCNSTELITLWPWCKLVTLLLVGRPRIGYQRWGWLGVVRLSWRGFWACWVFKWAGVT